VGGVVRLIRGTGLFPPVARTGYSALLGLVVLAALAFLIPFSCVKVHAGVDGNLMTGETPGTGASSAMVIPLQPAAAASVSSEPVDASSFWLLAGVDEEAALDAIMADMNDEERLGQLFMLSYGGDTPTALLYAWIRQRGLGGVKIFGWNADDTARLALAIEAIQDAAARGPHDVPPFVATDQEGGWIRHVKGGTSITPGNMAIGASARPSDAYNSALYIGQELSALAITMNFAPTVDLATRPDSTIIGSRAFSHDPMGTAILAAAWSRGMADAGVFATAKHYPGHGDTELDSHGVLPILDVDLETLWNRELVPYRLLVAEGLPGIMSGHLAFPRITGTNEPASLSASLLDDILRNRMGYEGLVITDDLMMTGAASPGGLAQTCERAIWAGNDILMFSRTLALDDPAWTRLLALYRRDALFKARVDQSARRVLRAKLRWLLPRGEQGVYPLKDAQNQMRSAESRHFFFEQAVRSATLLGSGTIPLDPRKRVLVASQFGDFFTEARARWPGVETFRFAYLPANQANAVELAVFKSRLAQVDTVLVSIANPASAEYARAVLAAGRQLYIVSVLSPSAALEFVSEAPVVAVYSYSRESYAAACAVLSGDVIATGRLPVTLSP
jgi:beta-N-acetylhexosaminidase